MDIDRIITGIVSLIASGCLFLYGDRWLVSLAHAWKKHHHEAFSSDEFLVMKIFVMVFRIAALGTGVIMLYQGITGGS